MCSRCSRSARSKPSSSAASALRSWAPSVARSSVSTLSSSSQPHRLFERPGHVEAERFAEPEGGFEHPAVEAADDQHRRAIILCRRGSAAARRRPCPACRGRARPCRAGRRGTARGNPSSLVGNRGSKPASLRAALARKSASAGSSSISSNRGCAIQAPSLASLTGTRCQQREGQTNETLF